MFKGALKLGLIHSLEYHSESTYARKVHDLSLLPATVLPEMVIESILPYKLGRTIIFLDLSYSGLLRFDPIWPIFP